MLALLVIAGAIVSFLAGWAWARMGRPIEATRESRLEAQHNRSVADVLDGHPTGVVVANRDGRVEYRNIAARRLDGTHTGVLLDAAIERHLALSRAGTTSSEVVEFYGPPKMVFDVTSRPLTTNGSVVFVDDISERRRIDQMRTDFVANISHELKTPIGALSVLAETLVDETDPDTVRRIVNRVLAEADRASDTIEDLMELSRIEAGGEQTAEMIRISDVIRGALDRVTEIATTRSISISTLEPVEAAGHQSDNLVVKGDRRQLVSAVGNLVENAVKYSDPGSSVQVRARDNGPWIEISVADQGAGIPQRDIDRIFERFYRVDRARSRTTGGTGLGLSIVRHVASNHHGEVLVASTEGEGSTFVLRLPRVGHTAAEGRAQDVAPTQHTPPHPGDDQHGQGVA